MTLVKMSNLESGARPAELSTQREDMIVIEGKFYSIDENFLNEHFIM